MKIGWLSILFAVMALIFIAASVVVTVVLVKYVRSDEFANDTAERAVGRLKKLRNSLIASYALAALLTAAAAVVKLTA